jgi:bifunctional oligoribonuclease and PAP phosphatase NrnA
MLFNFKIKKIYQKIKAYDTIVIARHIGPDPDAVSSQIALRDTIKATFPHKKVYAVGNGVAKFKYIGNLDKINEEELVKPLLIVLDLPNISRIDGVNFTNYKEAVKIDHHPYEDLMGDTEWVNPEASSTAEMITELVLNTPLKLTKKVAENLFIGIISDSNRFLQGSVKTMYIVAELIEESGIDPTVLYPKLYERPLAEIRFQGFIGENLTVTENGLGYIKITPEDILKYKVDSSTASNMINDFNYIQGVYVWMFISYDEKNKLYKVNIRSRGPVINEIASKYNGGGHMFASGVRTQNEGDVNNLLNDLDKVCAEYKKINS